jgi:predicted amidohydrolase
MFEMIVTCVQFDIAWHDKQANFAKIRSLLDSSGGCPAGGLLVLPEMFSTGFSMEVAVTAEGQQRPAEKFLGGLSRQYGCWTLGGVVTAVADGRGLNEAVMFAPGGAEALRYAKVHPFSYAQEDRYFAAGEGPVTVDMPPDEPASGQRGARLSPFVCYDLRFPETFRLAALAGAEVMVVIANWPGVRAGHWRALLAARAIENQAWVVGVNRVGADPHASYDGSSMVIDPRGAVVADAGTGEAVFSAELDIASLRQYRREFPAMADIRRADLGV